MRVFTLMMFVVTGCATTATVQPHNVELPELIIVRTDTNDARTPDQILLEFEQCMGFDIEDLQLTANQQTDRIITCLSRI